MRDLAAYDEKYQMMRKDKWLWFNGKMDEARVKELGTSRLDLSSSISSISQSFDHINFISSNVIL